MQALEAVKLRLEYHKTNSREKTLQNVRCFAPWCDSLPVFLFDRNESFN